VTGLVLLGGTDQIGRCLLDRTAAQPGVIVVGRTHPHRPEPRFLPADLAKPLPGLAEGAPAAIATLPIWLVAPHLPALAAAGVGRLVAFGSSSIAVKGGSPAEYDRTLVRRLEHGEAALQEAAAATGIGVTLLRPTLVYGLGLDRNVTTIARFIERRGFFPLPREADGLRQPVHADDLAAAALAALDGPTARNRSYMVGGGETLPYRKMVMRIFEALERKPRIVTLPGFASMLALAGKLAGNPDWTAETARRMARDQVFDNGPAARDFGYAPRRFLAAGRADLSIR
jgi:nucleoside-diphosphate-sugar epimerase